MRRIGWLLLALSGGCVSGEEPVAPDVASVFESVGAFTPGHTTVVVRDSARDRLLTLEIWYPAAAGLQGQALAGEPIESYVTDATDRATFAALVKKAPNPGTTRLLHAVRDAALDGAQAKWPIVAFSHCFNCMRFSTASIAERLASHGFAVIAPDHAGGTLFDEMHGQKGDMDSAFLEVRAADIRFALDVALGKQPGLPARLANRFDASRVGVFGHSFGGVTAGRVLMLDARPRAGLALAVPMENPLIPGVLMSAIKVPVFFLVAQEDNSITEFGNRFIRENFENAHPPVWKVEVKDAGHLSVTNICGIDDGFFPGCQSPARRQTDMGETFTYIDIDLARDVAASYVTAFFAAQLTDDPRGLSYVNGAHPAEWVEAASRR